MKAAALLLLLLWQAASRDAPPVAMPEHMQYERAISVPSGAGQACAVLDAQIFPHAAPSLRDLRIFPSPDGPPQDGASRELPYAITLSEAVSEETQAAQVLNLGASAKSGNSSG